jgi:hypothetical protein
MPFSSQLTLVRRPNPLPPTPIDLLKVGDELYGGLRVSEIKRSKGIILTLYRSVSRHAHGKTENVVCSFTADQPLSFYDSVAKRRHFKAHPFGFGGTNKIEIYMPPANTPLHYDISIILNSHGEHMMDVVELVFDNILAASLATTHYYVCHKNNVNFWIAAPLLF